MIAPRGNDGIELLPGMLVVITKTGEAGKIIRISLDEIGWDVFVGFGDGYMGYTSWAHPAQLEGAP